MLSQQQFSVVLTSLDLIAWVKLIDSEVFYHSAFSLPFNINIVLQKFHICVYSEVWQLLHVQLPIL